MPVLVPVDRIRTETSQDATQGHHVSCCSGGEITVICAAAAIGGLYSARGYLTSLGGGLTAADGSGGAAGIETGRGYCMELITITAPVSVSVCQNGKTPLTIG